MEQFSDLEPYIPESVQELSISSVTDELNTPTFDRKGFDFMVNENTCVQPSTIITTPTTTTTTADDPFKFEYELLRMDSVQTNKSNDSITYSNDSNNNINEMDLQQNFIDNSDNNNSIQDSEANQQQENLYIINNRNETPMHVQQIIDDNLNLNNNHNIEYIVNVTDIKSERTSSSPPSHLGFETPEDSNSCPDSEISSYNKPTPTNLKLNFNFFNQSPQTLNTPDVIDSVVDLEHSFNILDYVDDKEVSTVSLEDIDFEAAATTSTLLNNRTKVKAPKKPTAKTQRFRKRRSKRTDDDDDDDSDEDYLPPASKRYNKTQSTLITKRNNNHQIKCEESDSDTDDTGISSISNTTTTINNNRLKITKRTPSVCSDYSDASKYRELRDKNNEASRRSRLKRKMKELSLEKEADELNERNIKLKAQVEELEKMVSNFRNNLFKIMLKK